MVTYDVKKEREYELCIQEAKRRFLETEDIETLIDLLDTLMRVPYYMAWEETEDDSGFLRLTVYGTTYNPVLLPDGDSVRLAVFSSVARASEEFQTKYELMWDEDQTFLFEIFRSAKSALQKDITILIDPFDEGSVRITEDMLWVFPVFREIMGQKEGTRIKKQDCPECSELIETRAYSKYVRCDHCGIRIPSFFPSSPLWSGRSDSRVNGWRVCPVCRSDGTLIHRKYEQNWNCRWCGYTIPNKEWEDIVLWFCDECDTFMNVQSGFTTETGRWVCSVCGQENDVSDANIEEDYEEPLRLNTPLGEFFVLVDGKAAPYVAQKGDALKPWMPDLLGRYHIEITVEPDGRKHEIRCFPAGEVILEAEPEPGERLECLSYYGKNRVKLSIGIECESGYIDGERISDYDFDAECRQNALTVVILPTTKTTKYRFAIAWIDNVGPDNENPSRDVQPWYRADPSLR